MAFKMKYTNGKMADPTAFPFKGGVDAGSSPAKGFWKNIGKSVKKVTKGVDWGSVAKGAAGGAAKGSAAGPWGALIGGLGGAVMGGMGGGGEEQAPETEQVVDNTNQQNLPNQELTPEQQVQQQQQLAVA